MFRKSSFFLIIFLISPILLNSSAYIVQKSDTLWSISKHFGLKPDIILSVNDIPDNRVKEGQRLNIPDKIKTYTVEKGDNLTKIARENDSKPEYIIKLNNLGKKKIYPGLVLKLPVLSSIQNPVKVKKEAGIKESRHNLKEEYNSNGTFVRYKVEKGDTLSSIARKFNVKNNLILEWNHKTNESVFTGEKLKILSETQELKKEDNVKRYAKTNKEILKIDMEAGYSFPVNRDLIDYVSQTSRGVNIFLDKQTVIRSINNGIVEYAGKMNGYNNVVIVKYGEEQRAVYGFLHQTAVIQGSVVTNKQIIGDVNRTSFLGQIELYFEMRKGKETLDILHLFPFLKNESYLVKNNKASA